LITKDELHSVISSAEDPNVYTLTFTFAARGEYIAPPVVEETVVEPVKETLAVSATTPPRIN
jgi:hypothetical protein